MSKDHTLLPSNTMKTGANYLGNKAAWFLLSLVVSTKITADTGGLGSRIMRAAHGGFLETVQCEGPKVMLTHCLPDAEGES